MNFRTQPTRAHVRLPALREASQLVRASEDHVLADRNASTLQDFPDTGHTRVREERA